LTAEFQRLLAAEGIPLRVLPGADVRIDGDMIERLQSGDCLSLGDSRRYVLLELPHELYMPLEPVLDALRRLRMIGILSHPERNEGILRHPEVLAPLVARGCLMQVTADSVTGIFGEAPRSCAEMMVRQGLVHFVATDAHSPRSRRPRMREAMETIAVWAGRDYARAVGCLNPAAVADGRDCQPLPPPQGTPSRGGWFSKLFGGRAA
jgi:protein-tyrosine phosphatase